MQFKKTLLRASTREKDCFDLQRLTQCAMFINRFSKKVSIWGDVLPFICLILRVPLPFPNFPTE